MTYGSGIAVELQAQSEISRKRDASKISTGTNSTESNEEKRCKLHPFCPHSGHSRISSDKCQFNSVRKREGIIKLFEGMFLRQKAKYVNPRDLEVREKVLEAMGKEYTEQVFDSVAKTWRL